MGGRCDTDRAAPGHTTVATSGAAVATGGRAREGRATEGRATGGRVAGARAAATGDARAGDARTGALAWCARVLGAALLAASAYTHAHLAPTYDFGPAPTLGQLFVAQAVVAGVLALWLLRGGRAAWTVSTAVMAASAAAVLVSANVRIPAVGPLPAIYEPVWFTEKVVSAAVEVAFVALATVALCVSLPRSRPVDDRPPR